MGWRRLAILGVLGVFLMLFLFVGLLYAFARIPEPADLATAQSVAVVDADGRSVGRISAAADRVSIPLDAVPEHMRQAVISTEDRTFYSHPGVSVGGVVRAAITNAVGRGGRQGGSTITQQYVKNAFVGNERTYMRKMREAVLALKLERQRTKDEILALYLNTIYWGRGAYGIESAASVWFGKKAKDLSLPESAFLAGIVHAPETYDPRENRERALARRATVLKLMVRDGHITEEQAERASQAGLEVRRRRVGGTAAHYLEEVRRFLEQEIGPARLYAGGVRVRATIDVDAQRAAERAVREVYDRRSDPQVALVAVDPKTGAVRAMVGSRSFASMELNLAMRRRQPGSTFKPFVLSAAVADGTAISKRYPAPARTTLSTDSGPWSVSNYDRRGHGNLTIARATELSVNTVYAQMVLDVGPEEVARQARDLGIRSEVEPLPAIALGTEEVTPLEMASAYATWAARGVYREPYLVEEVRSKDGDVLYRARRESERAVEENVADTVNHVLQGVIRAGTGRSAAIGRPAAGKTGTTEDFRDAWFAGYTPDLATVVWNGFPGDGKKLRDVRGRNVTGGSFPAQIWKGFMAEALRDVPASDFATPDLTGSEGDATPSEEPSETDEPTGSASPSTKPTGGGGEPKPSTSPKPTVTSSPTPTPTATETETSTAEDDGGGG